MPAGKARACKGCQSTTRPVPYPGPRCATCNRAVKRVRRTAARDRRVVGIYGLAPGDWQRLFDAQGGKCFICQRFKAKAVDHDHSCCSGPTSCGRCVRGLLCGTCNTGIGRWRDDVDTFLRAVEYLRNPPAQRVLNRGFDNEDPQGSASLRATLGISGGTDEYPAVPPADG